MKVIRASALAAEVLDKIRANVAEMNPKPGLAVIRVGNDPASWFYARSLRAGASLTGIYFEEYIFPPEVSQDNLIQAIRQLNQEKKIHGILVLVPLPGHLETKIIIDAIAPQKDVDGFGSANYELIALGRPFIVPVVPSAALKLALQVGQPLNGKRVVLVVKGKHFIAPFQYIFERCSACNFQFVRPDFENFDSTVSEAEVLIPAVGSPGLIKAHHVRQGAIILDVGTTKRNGSIVGDVDASVSSINCFATPVPGGVGGLTPASLLENLLNLTIYQSG